MTYLKHNKKGKPIGKPVVDIVFQFNTAMNPATADNVNNYQVGWISTRKIKKRIQTVLHPIGVLSATSNASNTSVTLATSATKTKFPKGGQVTIAGGVSGAAGGFLAGNFVFIISPKANAIHP